MHQPKRRFPRKLMILGGALVGLLVVAAVALPYLVDVNQYRGLIQSKAEEAIGRKVTLGEMSLRVFPTIGIRVESPEVEGLLKADSLVVGVRLMPLLMSDTIDVRMIVLARPSITIARDAGGRWNFQDISESAGGSQESGEASTTTGRSFRLSSLSIEQASIHLLDERSGSSLDVGLTASGSMEVTANGDMDAAFDGDLESDGIALAIRGSIARSSSEATEFDILVDRSDLDLTALSDLARSWEIPWPVPEGLLRSETLTLGGRAAGTLQGEALTGLAVSDLVVRNADLSLTRDSSGRWNFETALAGGGASGNGETTTSTAGPSIEARNVRVAGARVALHDEATGAGTADVVLEDLDILIEELVLDSPVRLEVQSRITPGDGSLKLTGSIPTALPSGGSQAAIDATLELEDVAVAPLAAYLEALLGSGAQAGTVSGTVAVQGDYPRQIETKGTIRLDGITAQAAPRPVTAQADFEATLLDAATRMEIERFEADVASSHVELRGWVDNSGTGTLVDIEVLPTSVHSDDLHDLLVISGTQLPFEFSADEPIRLQAHVKGDIRSETPPDLSGSLEVEEATFRHASMSKPMESLAGKVTLEKDGFRLTGFSAIIGSSDMAGNLTVQGFAAPRVSFDIESEHADFWELMSFVEGDESSGTTQGGGAAEGTDDSDYLEKVEARGTLRIAEGSFGSLSFTNLDSTLGLERKIVTLDPVSMDLYSGSMSGSATMDMTNEPPVVGVTARAQRIDTDALLVSNLQLENTLAGAMSGELTVTTSGSDERQIIKNARGSGEIRLENGRVGAVNVLGVLSKASDLMGEQSLKEVSSRLAEEGTEFSSMSTSMKLDGGKVKARKMSLVSADLELAGQGTLDLVDGTIDLEAQVIFSEGLSQTMVNEGSRAVDVFWDTDSGRVNLPLTLAGPVDAPSPNIDWGRAGDKLVKRKIEESVQKKLAEAGLSQLLGDKKGILPVKSRGDKEKEAPPEPLPPPSEGDLGAIVRETSFSGNLLFPDLEIKGLLRGTAITSASISVIDEEGNVLHEGSLMRRVKKYYTQNDRSVPQSIAFGHDVDGKDLLVKKGDLSLVISIRNEAGNEITETVAIKR